MASRRVKRNRALYAAFVGMIVLSLVMNAFSSEKPHAKPRATPSTTPAPTLSSLPPSATQLSARGFTLSPDACIAFAPTGISRGTTVFLDAGHGGVDPGTAGHTSSGRLVREKAATLALVKVATAQLRAEGYRVVVSRWVDTVVAVPGPGDLKNGVFTADGARHDILARIACANASGARALVSVHMNALTSSTVGGSLTIWDPDRSFSVANKQLATLLQRNIITSLHDAGLPVPDLSILKDTQNHGTALTAEGAAYGHEALIGPYKKSWVPDPTTMPGAIIEPLFLTRPTEADIVTSATGQRVLARAITAAIDQFLAA